MMKNFLAILFALILSTMCFTLVVHAAPSDPDGYMTNTVFQTLIDEIETTYSITIPDNEQANWWQIGFNPQDNWYLFFNTTSGGNMNFYFFPNATYDETNNTITTTLDGKRRYYEARTTAFLAYNVSAGTFTLNSSYQIIGYFGIEPS